MATTIHPGPTATGTTSIGAVVEPLVDALFGGRPQVSFEFWDGSRLDGGASGTMRLNNPDALRRLLWSPDELGVSRAFVAGEIDAIGDTAAILRALQSARHLDASARLRVAAAATRVVRALGGVGTKPPVPAEEMVPRGVRHSLGRDRQVVRHHYDVGNDFYALVLGPAMTYSCARFIEADTTLEDAQTAKHELICRKLGLDAGSTPAPVSAISSRRRLLDVGCGWASMALHAATNHDVDVVGVTLSAEQAAHGRARVEQLGLSDRIEIRIQDYREIDDGPYDAISSIGMAEHVGVKRMPEYFSRLHALLRPGGRLLNHAISAVGGSRLGRRSFVNRYVFPDGELLDVADTVRFMEDAGFEVRDVENLREHYAQTLRCWVANLQRHWDDAVDLVGEARCRVWLLYMSGSINGFEDHGLQINQTLGVRLHDGGRSDMCRTRRAWG